MPTFLYVAEWMGPGRGAISVFSWDGSGRFDRIAVCRSGIEKPFHLTADVARRRLYAADFGSDESQGGQVAALEIAPETGKLHARSAARSGGQIPVFVATSPDGDWVLVANCGPFTPGSEGRTVSVLAATPSGVAAATQIVQHAGTSTDPERQTGPHPHAVAFDPSGRFVLVPDLGSDRIVIYRFERGRLAAHTPAFAAVPPGTGPRHIRFHPNGRIVFVNGEIDPVVVALRFEPERGELLELQTIPCLPPGETCGAGAELVIHPHGRFLYASNRVHGSVSIVEIDPSSGAGSLVEVVSTQGESPRGLAIDPDGKFLVVGNEKTGSLRSWSIDPQSGRLTPTGSEFSMEAPGHPEFVRL